jgi:carbon storage regulator CsrA
MLVLSRKSGEGIVLDGGITITVLEAFHGKVRLGIQAPENVLVLREELAGFKNLRTRARVACRGRQLESPGRTPCCS